MAQRSGRLGKEFARLKCEPVPGISVSDCENLGMCRCEITGPPDTVYQDGVWEVELTFPDRYPFQPPAVKFITKVPKYSTRTFSVAKF